MAVNTYIYKIKGRNESVTLYEDIGEGELTRVEASYGFSSLPEYRLLMSGGAPVGYSCNCEGCTCEATCPNILVHQPDCLAHGIFGYTFLLREIKNNETGAPTGDGHETSVRPLVMPLNEIIHPLIAHFNRHRDNNAGDAEISVDILDRVLSRLRRVASTTPSPPVAGSQESDTDHFTLTLWQCQGRLDLSHKHDYSVINRSVGATVFIPQATLVNSPDSPTPDILPLAFLSNPVLISNDQGRPETLSFDADFLTMPSADFWEQDRSLAANHTVSGRYSISLSSGEFTLTITPPETSAEASAFQVTGSISPTNELETAPEPVRSPPSGFEEFLANLFTATVLFTQKE